MGSVNSLELDFLPSYPGNPARRESCKRVSCGNARQRREEDWVQNRSPYQLAEETQSNQRCQTDKRHVVLQAATRVEGVMIAIGHIVESYLVQSRPVVVKIT